MMADGLTSTSLRDPSSRGGSVFEEVEKNMAELWDNFHKRQKSHMGLPETISSQGAPRSNMSTPSLSK